MADQATVDKVNQNLPGWATELTDWTDAKIGGILDSNCQNVGATVRLFWLQRVSELSAITDITDTASSRPLSQTYQHAVDMLKYWDRIAGVDATKVSKIKRRYRRHHGIGVSPYGGVYGRVD